MGVNYDQMAEDYDRLRRGGGPYLDTVLRLARRHRVSHALELGSGTGNNTAAFLKAHPCRITAVEPSRGMLSRAALKNMPVRWVRGAAEYLPFPDKSFDFLFGIYMLHYIRCLDVLFQECRRVLRHGYAAFVTAPVTFIARHPMNAYFPSFAAIDLQRFRPETEIQAVMAAAGFQEVSLEYVKSEPCAIDAAYVDRIAGKFVSTYALLPAEEFNAGLTRLRRDVQQHGSLDTPIVWEGVVIHGSIERMRPPKGQG